MATSLSADPLRRRQILPLPPDVRSRLRSTLAITAFPLAISELLQNSLDASATTITVTANLSRPSFTITDDGHGILGSSLPAVGTFYATSKYPPPVDTRFFGFRGEAVAALATHSVLTVASRAEGYRSTNWVRWSYGKRVAEGPAPEYARLLTQGTVVRVEGLWADLPVRLKAREKEDPEKEWEAIARAVVQVLLAGKKANVVVRDENGNRKVVVRTGTGVWELAVLRQGLGVKEEGWEPVKARQGAVRIEGWICTRGTPGRGLQFLLVNGHPISSENNILHEEVNRIFANSAFGGIDDGAAKRGAMKKTADRRGMFVLHIYLHNHDPSLIGGEGGTEGKAGVEGENLGAVVELLRKLVYEFLRTHLFMPFGAEPSALKKPVAPMAIVDMFAKQRPVSISSSPSPSNPKDDTSKSFQPAEEHRMMDLSNWSRVKVAKMDEKEAAARISTGGTNKTLAVRPGNAPQRLAKKADDTVPAVSEDPKLSSSGEQVLDWLNPKSRKLFQINIRTGMALPRSADLDTSSIGTKRSSALSLPNPRLSPTAHSVKRTKTSNTSRTSSFVENLLSNFKNPVLRTTEAPIPQISFDTPHDTISFTADTSQRLGRVSKSALQNCTVISQIDSKYILIRTPDKMLIVIDQHAASERIRAEKLFADLCSAESRVKLEPPINISLSTDDTTLLRRHRTTFIAWNIDFEASSTSVTVTTLPAIAADRPSLDIKDFLRRSVTEIEEGRLVQGEDSKEWWAKLAGCPGPLKEIVNSRSCRGAVMFGDELNIDECRELVEKLAQTRWPFMCAHGRPSLRPLVELGSVTKGKGVRSFKQMWHDMENRKTA